MNCSFHARTRWLALAIISAAIAASSQYTFGPRTSGPALLAGEAATPQATPWPQIQKAPLSADELGFDEIVFIKRKPFSSDHYYTDIDNGTSPDRFVPGNGIYVFNIRSQAERPVVTAASLPGGSGLIGKISLSFDAKKVLFDFRERADAGFRIWEVNLDGTGLHQVLLPPQDEAEKVARWGKPWHTDDIHPCYLPDGKIMFTSTRSEHTVLCGGSAHLTAPSLYRMHADGTHVEQLTQSPVSEFCPVVLDDGRVLYHRWEYIDRGARVSKTLWSMNPDGGKAEEVYGIADDSTTVFMYPQPVPDSEHRLVCVGTCHYPQGGCVGSIELIDYKKGVREAGPDPQDPTYAAAARQSSVTNITPQVFVERHTEPGWHFITATGSYEQNREGKSGYLYTHPYPISRHEFLVSVKTDPSAHYQNVPNAYAICLLDTNGRHRFVHDDAELSCWHPLPLVPRKVPPCIESTLDPKLASSDQALCVIGDVYQGMEGIPRGEIKWLRINEALPRYWSTGRRWDPSLSSSAWKAALWPRVQWGVVPVEQDGSAQFLVPANRAVFFQALDKDFREVQRERTYVNYRPGEVRSCGGCHGQATRTLTRTSSTTPLALTRPPSVPQPQPCDLAENGGTGLAGQVIHYPTDIQPILDAKCVRCHGQNNPAGNLKLTGEPTTFYNTSYEELARKELAGPIISEFTSFLAGDRGNYNGAYLPPRNLGCAKSSMMSILTDKANAKNAKDDHSTMLTAMELMILSRWVDSNYQYYGSYFGRQHPQWLNPDPNKPEYNPADFRRKATFEEATSFFAPAWHR